MKTDVLLTHAPYERSKCAPEGGEAINDEYIVYDAGNYLDGVILTLGGSTTDGFYKHLSAGKSWPRQLSELDGNTFKVINGGVGGYTSLQELLKFLRDGQGSATLNT